MSIGSSAWRIRCLCAATLVVVWSARGQNSDGYWDYPGGGSWANSGNWDSGTIADGEDSTAYFGLSLFATIPANATFTLDGARTIGDIEFLATTGPDNWALNTGSGGPLTLDNTFNPPPINVSFASQTVTINAVLAGTNGMEKLGSGTLILSATNSYSGETIVSAGALRVNGVIGFDAVTVAGSAMLGGTGIITSPVTIQSGGSLTPGSLPGRLTISNSLTLQSGCTTIMKVNALTLAHDFVSGMSALNYSGNLIVSNLAGTPALGQSFQLFSAASYSGNFSSLSPQPTGGARWRFDPAGGVLSVVSTASQPWISAASLSSGNLVLQVVNGAPGVTNYLLSSTNLTLPMTAWTRLATNIFDISGKLYVTNLVNFNTTQRFFGVSVPIGP